MNFQRSKKILSFFVLMSFLLLPVYNIYAVGLDYNNPNKGGFNTNQYRLGPNNPEAKAIGISILGCVDGGARMTDLITGALNDILNRRQEKVATAYSALVTAGLLVGDKNKTILSQEVYDKKAETNALKAQLLNERNAQRENCLNGIAYTLAKNQLSKMAGATLTWVQTGFKGDPLYVQNNDSLYSSIRKDSINNIKDVFGLVQNRVLYPYGASVTAGLINSYRGQNSFADSMITTLPYYLANGATPQQFASDFSLGGWNGWLALTQYPQNNPLGSTMLIAQYAADEQARKIGEIKEQQARNGGILDQTTCIEWSKQTGDPGQTETEIAAAKALYEKTKTCLKTRVVTPGSIIKDKLSKVINSPETQLELAHGINETLNVLFSNLIDKFRTSGLSRLSTNVQDFVNSSDGIGSNKVFDEKGNVIPGVGISRGGFSGAFDITKDLNDVYGPPEYGGEWDANTNTPQFASTIGDKNTYYNVTVAGNTSLDGVKNWKVGEKAFFDGKNWTKTVPKIVLIDRGVISTQLAYVDQVNQKENKAKNIPSGSLQILPKITPAVGELDYCIPGPNPEWQRYANQSYLTYSDYLSGFSTITNIRKPTGFGKQACVIGKMLLGAGAAALTGGGSSAIVGAGKKIGGTLASIGINSSASAANSIINCDSFASKEDIKEDLVTPETNTYDNIFKRSPKVLADNKKQEFYTLIDRNALGGVPTRNGGKEPGYDNVNILEVYNGHGTSWNFYDPTSLTFPYLKDVVAMQIQKWIYVTNNLYTDYESDIKKRYGPMVDPSAGSSYLPMASSGLAITKDIDMYEENTQDAYADYKTQISTALENKIKLCDIKRQVDAIVLAANTRRNDERRKLGQPLVSLSCNLPPQTTYKDPCTSGLGTPTTTPVLYDAWWRPADINGPRIGPYITKELCEFTVSLPAIACYKDGTVNSSQLLYPVDIPKLTYDAWWYIDATTKLEVGPYIAQGICELTIDGSKRTCYKRGTVTQ